MFTKKDQSRLTVVTHEPRNCFEIKAKLGHYIVCHSSPSREKRVNVVFRVDHPKSNSPTGPIITFEIVRRVANATGKDVCICVLYVVFCL